MLSQRDKITRNLKKIYKYLQTDKNYFLGIRKRLIDSLCQPNITITKVLKDIFFTNSFYTNLVSTFTKLIHIITQCGKKKIIYIYYINIK